MEKYAWRAKLYDGKKKEYIKRHNEIWNEMLQVLNDAGIKNYSIWIDGSDVFGYYECEKGMPGKNTRQKFNPKAQSLNGGTNI